MSLESLKVMENGDVFSAQSLANKLKGLTDEWDIYLAFQPIKEYIKKEIKGKKKNVLNRPEIVCFNDYSEDVVDLFQNPPEGSLPVLHLEVVSKEPLSGPVGSYYQLNRSEDIYRVNGIGCVKEKGWLDRKYKVGLVKRNPIDRI